MTGDDQVYVQPGEVHWSREPCLFKTVLGSCVSVCLWDAAHGIGGMTHFILPHARAAGDSARFGDVAVPLLAAKLRALGGTRLVAKVFGGGNVLRATAGVTIGDGNVSAALALLRAEGITVVAQRTGGLHGIVIQFSTADGSVEVNQIKDAPPAPARRNAVAH